MLNFFKIDRWPKILLIILAVLTIVSCKFTDIVVTQPLVEDPVCPAEGSWLCEQSEKMGVTLETTYGWIYNSVAIAAIADKVKISEVCEFEQEIADWYAAVYPISYDTVIVEIAKRIKLMDDPQKVTLIKNILNKNLNIYSSPLIVSKSDDTILRKGHTQFRQDMLCDF